ncbi:MAG: hypothetical protein ACE3JP_01205 [Ectobacillus sp.]
MGKCNIDHSHEDVVKKLESQQSFLPEALAKQLYQFLESELPQQTLNELFHLLKKYDLSSVEERKERNRKMALLIG